MEEATFLTKFASKVYVIHRRDELRASKVMQERLFSKDNAEVLWNKVVVDCLSEVGEMGNEKITGVLLEDTQTGERSELPLKGLFVAIGHTPATKFLKDCGLEFDEKGYIDLKTRRARRTSRGSSPRAMSPTRPTARPSPPRAWGARPRSTPSNGSRRVICLSHRPGFLRPICPGSLIVRAHSFLYASSLAVRSLTAWAGASSSALASSTAFSCHLIAAFVSPVVCIASA